jgi:hypothetical protein
LILFVNGYILGCEPLRPYWSSSGKDPDEFINAACNYFQDDHISSESFINGSSDWFGSKAWSRQGYGRSYGKEHLPKIKSLLSTNESVNIVSHSMGAATAEGIIEVLSAANIRIGKVIHFAPSNAAKIKIATTTAHIDRLQVNATGDFVIEKLADPFAKDEDLRIPGVKVYGRVKWDPWVYHKKHMSYIKDKKLPFNLDSHFDLKTYAFVFDWVKDLENIRHLNKIGERTSLSGQKSIYSLDYELTHGTRFQNLFIDGNYYEYLEEYQKGRSDKYMKST